MFIQCKPTCIKTQHHTYRGSACRAATVHGRDNAQLVQNRGCPYGTTRMTDSTSASTSWCCGSAWQQIHTGTKLKQSDFASVGRVRRGGGSRGVPGFASAALSAVSDLSSLLSGICSGCACTMLWIMARNIRLYSPCRCHTSLSISPAICFAGFLFLGVSWTSWGYKISRRHDWSWST